MTGVVLICAGGTGGHLFPAEALALELGSRGWTVHLATDHRVDSYARDFPAEKIHIIPSATITRDPIAAARAIVQLGRGLFAARRLIRDLKPEVAIGFGGYPTLPPMLAATWARVPTIVHDANAVLGRANTFLARRVTTIATAFDTVKGAEGFADRAVETGNPVRAAVLEAAKTPYPARTADAPFRLLAFGGSQGARFLSDLVPAAAARLSPDTRGRLVVTQQCRPEDLDRVAKAYGEIGVAAELESFFGDMPARIAASHLVVSRSGASTVAELAVIGRPAIMVPLPHALDQDQKANAAILEQAGGGWMVAQADLTPERLAGELEALIADPARLSAAADAARGVGRPNAVENLADLVETVATEKRVNGKAIS
ncbi:undecaprenyldiphospho-muramoylpentapeptide beta-N-acetylglucosaminyltransferase [Bauldia litoralis]|uniref:UDP-N-acetylglucosamine--N-acetylmuramyl-(pentapeptide) pyrophosphoryl-undecaprenol N-acetylglucosamine transferase n=1 Tax=Bauldia litoralis TaxID=665467 RepID=A0A1G6D3I9_9HYPH|nr:undecaprenyldiphospho-muramoylpentapeptide beta-N-acetylglucosaminyltransferase [Bauldia litoralis]SDB39651.1 UDP-N-acetylglucosamine-N-acetylmuramylpentapeptide N-acetylglucosamine transferase [Bauldia litoralis]